MIRGYEIAKEKLIKMEKREYSGSNATAIFLAISLIEGNKEKADDFAHQLELIEKSIKESSDADSN